MKIALYLVFGIAHISIAIFCSTWILARSRAAEDRPFTELFAGLFLVAVSVIFASLAFSGVHSGTIGCALKGCNAKFQLAEDPFGFWTSFATFYVMCLAPSSLGLTLVRKAFSRS